MRSVISGKLCAAIAAVVVGAACQATQAGFVSAVAGTYTLGTNSDGGKLLGTSFDPANDTLAEVNAAVGLWNAEFGPPNLLSALNIVGKFEDPVPGTLSDSLGPLLTSNFEFYTTTDGTTFTAVGSPIDILSVAAIGFKWIGPAGGDAGLQYYTPKSDNTSGGFSVFSYTSGVINLAYVDNDGDLGTFDPRANDRGKGYNISHLSFYGDPSNVTVTEVVPEPSSIILLGLGSLGAVAAARRRKQQAA